MAISLCVPPRNGELCAPVRIRLRSDSSTLELTSRHRVTGVEMVEDQVVVCVEIADPATARPVDVRFDVQPVGGEVSPRSRLVGRVERDGESLDVYGTYLGVVADEN